MRPLTRTRIALSQFDDKVHQIFHEVDGSFTMEVDTKVTNNVEPEDVIKAASMWAVQVGLEIGAETERRKLAAQLVAAREAGYSEGREIGYDTGYDVGRESGYDAGYDAARAADGE